MKLVNINEGDKVENEFYCPECKSKLEKISGCGSVSYFCQKCNSLISRKRILSEKEAKEEA